MAEDWVRLQLGMRLQIDVLRYKSNTVCARALLGAQQGVSPPNIGSGKEEPPTNAQNISVCFFLVCACCRKSGVN